MDPFKGAEGKHMRFKDQKGALPDGDVVLSVVVVVYAIVACWHLTGKKWFPGIVNDYIRCAEEVRIVTPGRICVGLDTDRRRISFHVLPDDISDPGHGLAVGQELEL